STTLLQLRFEIAAPISVAGIRFTVLHELLVVSAGLIIYLFLSGLPLYVAAKLSTSLNAARKELAAGHGADAARGDIARARRWLKILQILPKLLIPVSHRIL